MIQYTYYNTFPKNPGSDSKPLFPFWNQSFYTKRNWGVLMICRSSGRICHWESPSLSSSEELQSFGDQKQKINIQKKTKPGQEVFLEATKREPTRSVDSLHQIELRVLHKRQKAFEAGEEPAISMSQKKCQGKKTPFVGNRYRRNPYSGYKPLLLTWWSSL